MPELPEVETISSQLDSVLRGKIFSKVEVLRDKSAQTDLSLLVGRKIKKVRRLAKQIKIDLKNVDETLLIHLKMTGQLVYQKSKTDDLGFENRVVGGHPTRDWINKLPSSHTRIVAKFEDGSSLFFNDQRVFGWWKLVSKKNLEAIKSKLPPDVIDKEFDVDYLKNVLSRSKRAVKLVILDQQKMGGMGNIYTNDSLWLAKINPKKPANKLKDKEIIELHKQMVRVLKEGISLGGASISDYVHVSGGGGGGYQEIMRVYEREGKSCSRRKCDGVIKKEKLGGRGTYYCNKCQI